MPKFSRADSFRPLRKLRPKQPRKNRKNEIFAKRSFSSFGGCSLNGNPPYRKGKMHYCVALAVGQENNNQYVRQWLSVCFCPVERRIKKAR